ncbi:DUF262 domain-containing HNH endonuclease family protein [Nocardioides panacisoli]|uniref:DUF262 domain-containing protein n=1 Tax=Nocardioides panacisoli TaxID=627624 RepID=A0ABP7HZ86_9ACTN
MSKLDTAHGPFVELIDQGRIFYVPEYQRAYSWRANKSVAELWSDILRLYTNAIDHGRTDSHFIGSVVVGAASTKALGPVECPIIDGQQRLITLSLIVAAIRDELVDDPAEKAEITQQYLAHFKQDKISSSRVRPGADDRASYDEIIQQGDPDKRTLVYKAYAYIVDRLYQGPTEEDADPDVSEDSGDKADSADETVNSDLVDADTDFEDDNHSDDDGQSYVVWDWETLLSVVGTQLELVSISDVPPESAYQIFATLNSKGLPLSQVDLTRNAVFMLMPKGGKRAHAEFWTPMEAVMGKELLQAYLHTWVIRHGYNVPAKEIYSSAVKLLSPPGFSEASVRKQLRDMHNAGWTYLLITRPNIPSDRAKFGAGVTVPKAIVAALVRLQEWGVVPMEPVLMEVLDRFRGGQLKQADVLRILSYLESFVVRRFIAQVPPNDLRSIFARLTQQIRRKTTASAFESALLEGLSEKLRRWPTDAELTDAMMRRPLYRPKGQRWTFFVLKRIAVHLDGKEAPQIVIGTTRGDYSIEHILPQSFPAAWRMDLASWGDPDPQETWQTLVDVSGNLTLTAYNSELSNLPFNQPGLKMDKRRWIKGNLRLELSKMVLANQRWTRAEIDLRSTSLAKTAITIWPLP